MCGRNSQSLIGLHTGSNCLGSFVAYSVNVGMNTLGYIACKVIPKENAFQCEKQFHYDSRAFSSATSLCQRESGTTV